MGSRTLNNTLPRGLQDPVKVSVPLVSARSFGHDRGREILVEQARLPRRTAPRADRQNPYDADARPVREREDVARLQRMVRLVRVCAVDANPTRRAGAGCQRTALAEASVPEPLVQAHALFAHRAERSASSAAKGDWESRMFLSPSPRLRCEGRLRERTRSRTPTSLASRR